MTQPPPFTTTGRQPTSLSPQSPASSAPSSRAVLATVGQSGVTGPAANYLLGEVGRIWSRIAAGRPASRVQRLRLGVCATHAGEGSTAVATNFAIFLAQQGRRVAVVEANFVRPGLAQVFDDLRDSRRAGGGVWGLLDGTALLHEVPRKVDANLTIVPAGTPPADYAAQVDDEAVVRLIEFLEQDHDVVVLDLPPLATAAEARRLLRLTECVVLVARANRVRRDDLLRSVASLRDAAAPLAGIVLNDVTHPLPTALERLFR